MITQRDFKDCGVTCMEYIIKFYHGYIPIEKLREDLVKRILKYENN